MRETLWTWPGCKGFAGNGEWPAFDDLKTENDGSLAYINSGPTRFEAEPLPTAPVPEDRAYCSSGQRSFGGAHVRGRPAVRNCRRAAQGWRGEIRRCPGRLPPEECHYGRSSCTKGLCASSLLRAARHLQYRLKASTQSGMHVSAIGWDRVVRLRMCCLQSRKGRLPVLSGG